MLIDVYKPCVKEIKLNYFIQKKKPHVKWKNMYFSETVPSFFGNNKIIKVKLGSRQSTGLQFTMPVMSTATVLLNIQFHKRYDRDIIPKI